MAGPRVTARGFSRLFPAQPLFAGFAPESYSYYIRSQYTAIEQGFTTSKMSALLSEMMETGVPSVVRVGYRWFSVVAPNSEKQ
mgnify:CR=1 FL=1